MNVVVQGKKGLSAHCAGCRVKLDANANKNLFAILWI
jgi:hypothetical protein